MPYSTTVSLLDTEGGSPSLDVSGRVWMTYYVPGSGTGTGNQQFESDRIDGEGSPRPVRSTSPLFPGQHELQPERARRRSEHSGHFRVANDTGWLFRSGEYPDDLPAESVEIVTAARTLNDADLAGALPALPLTVDTGTGTVLNAITATLGAAGIDVSATGTTNAVGPTVGLTFTATLVVSPSADVRRPEQEALSIVMTNAAVSFAPGPNVASSVSAAVLNAIRPVLLRSFGPSCRADWSR